MSLESCEFHFDVVLFGFYGVLENALHLLLPGSAIFLTKNIYGGFRELEPYLLQNFDHSCISCGASPQIETSKEMVTLSGSKTSTR